MNNFISSTELKAKLSKYRRLVETGQSFLITLRGAPVARIGPVKKEILLDDAMKYMDKFRQNAPLLSNKKLKMLRHEDPK